MRFSITSIIALLAISTRVAIAADYMFHAGFMGDEGKIHQGFFQDVAAARTWCDNNYNCGGFTFMDGGHHGVQQISVIFKSRQDTNVVYSKGWSSYTKQIMPTKYTYSYQPGFIDDDGELAHHNNFMSMQEAQGVCENNERCAGFQMKSTNDQVENPYVVFKSGAKSHGTGTRMVYTNEDFHSYVKKRDAGSNAGAFTFQRGFISEGREIHSGFLSIQEAENWCAANNRCRGFYMSASVEQSAPFKFIRFYDSASVSTDPAWHAYIKN